MCAEPAAPGAAGGRIGILGGTFDPVHRGHIESAREIAEAFALDRVLLVLSARPPHKSGAEAAPAALRWRMLELAVAEAVASGGTPLEACDIELRRDGPSWTVDTLRGLAARYPGSELFLILGADAYAEIDTWSRPGELLELASIIVTSRPGHGCAPDAPIPPVAARAQARYDPDIAVTVHTSGHTLRGHRIRGIEASATDIRRRVRQGHNVCSLTGDAVARFIVEHRLYGSGGADASAGDAAPNPDKAGQGRKG